MSKVLDWFHALSGRKIVTYIGLAISSVASTCVLTGDEWLVDHFGTWAHSACGTAIFVGGVIAAFGKGLGDRRVDPERQEKAPVERREPTEEQKNGEDYSGGN